MNNPGHGGENHHRQGQPPTGLPPHLQHHLQQQQRAALQNPQLAFLLANAAAARGQQPGGGGPLPGHLGAGNSNHGGGFGGPSPFGNGGERHGNAGGLSQSSAAAQQLFEEQILQRASALRAEAIMQRQQNQQQSQQQLQIQATLKALQQQQLAAPAPSPEEVALLARAAALRDMQLSPSAPVSALDRIRDAELARMREQIVTEELLRQRQQQKNYGLEREIEEHIRQTQIAAIKAAEEKQSAGAAALAANSVQATKANATPTKPKKNDAPSNETPKTSKKDTPAKAEPTAPPLKPNPKSAKPTNEKSDTAKKSAGAGAAAAAAVRCKTREELQKNPGTVIVPCRARGMPMDHNFIVRLPTRVHILVFCFCNSCSLLIYSFEILIQQSAYFVISEDAKHGENLVCSYYACRNGGIKFRYCAYCMAPVAKRNFSRRHDHGMSKKKGALSLASSKDDEDDDEDDETVDESELTVSDRGSLSENVISSNSSAVAKKKETASLEDETKQSRLENIQLETVGEKDVSSERREMWNDLLNKRPRSKDPKGLSKWLNEVLSVSDLQFPLEKVGAENARGGSPLGRVLSNELSKLTKDGAVDSAMDTTNSSSTTADTLTKDTANSSNDGDSTKKETTPVKDNTVASKSDMKSLKKNLGKRKKDNDDDDDETDSDEGFAGSFADWRDRKKGKSLKKGPSSLKK